MRRYDKGVNESTYTTYCEYCGESFSRRYTADRDKADHKRKCVKKRYLGGDIEVETADDMKQFFD